MQTTLRRAATQGSTSHANSWRRAEQQEQVHKCLNFYWMDPAENEGLKRARAETLTKKQIIGQDLRVPMGSLAFKKTRRSGHFLPDKGEKWCGNATRCLGLVVGRLGLRAIWVFLKKYYEQSVQQGGTQYGMSAARNQRIVLEESEISLCQQ